MLVLSRRDREAVVLETADGPLRVTVVDIDRGKVRLGFEAPPRVKIWREELIPPPAAPK